MFCHPVKGYYQLTPPSSRFYLVHLPGEFLLDALAQPDKIRMDDIAEEVDALLDGEHPFIGLDLQVNHFHPPVDDVTHRPQFRFRLTEYQAVIAIAVVMTDPVLVFQIMV